MYILYPNQIGLFTKSKAIELGRDFNKLDEPKQFELITDPDFINRLKNSVLEIKKQNNSNKKSDIETQLESMKAQNSEPIPDVQPERGKAIDIKTDEQVDVFRLTKKEKSIVRKLGEPGITIEITDKYTGAKSLSFKKTGKLNITKCSNLLGLDVKTFKHYKPLFDNAISSREKQS